MAEDEDDLVNEIITRSIRDAWRKMDNACFGTGVQSPVPIDDPSRFPVVGPFENSNALSHLTSLCGLAYGTMAGCDGDVFFHGGLWFQRSWFGNLPSRLSEWSISARKPGKRGSL